MKIAIKCPAPRIGGALWGDYHFAQSLAKALRGAGATVRVDFREDWECALSETDDVALVLRGVRAYKPKPHQKNVLWLISHPDDISLSELNEFDQVFVASSWHARVLEEQCSAPVAFLPQCTDTDRFRFDREIVNSRSERVLFVGNSRGAFRETVRWIIDGRLDVEIYGSNWERFIPEKRVTGKHIPNEVLGEFYASSKAVLCDHWDEMRKLGYVSNRVFDVLASGGRLIVDEVTGMHDLLPPDAFEVFRSAEELKVCIERSPEIDLERRFAVARSIAAQHSFKARAETIVAKIREMDALSTRRKAAGASSAIAPLEQRV